MNIMESVYLAFDSVRGNKLRAFLSLLSVTIGVFAIIGAGTLTQSIENAVVNEMAGLGETTFVISKMPTIMKGNEWRKYNKRKTITYRQFNELKRKLDDTEFVSSSCQTSGESVKGAGISTDPDVTLTGGDESILLTTSRDIKTGRQINAEDISMNRNVALIGNDIVIKLFPEVSPLGKIINIKNQKFEIIGVIETKGAVLGQSQDNLVIIPISQYLKYFTSEWEESLTISIRAKNKEALDQTIQEAINQFRLVRNLKPWQENDFEISTNDSISEQFSGLTDFLTYFGLICGIVSLGAAGIGITNIMLVSVKERTREIGIRKAVGARNRWILYQFIIETITLCQIGGAIGIVAGISGAWVLSIQMKMPLVFPLNWIIIAIVICTFLGLLSGAYPAWRAAKLDPIDALRYE